MMLVEPRGQDCLLKIYSMGCISAQLRCQRKQREEERKTLASPLLHPYIFLQCFSVTGCTQKPEGKKAWEIYFLKIHIKAGEAQRIKLRGNRKVIDTPSIVTNTQKGKDSPLLFHIRMPTCGRGKVMFTPRFIFTATSSKETQGCREFQWVQHSKINLGFLVQIHIFFN